MQNLPQGTQIQGKIHTYTIQKALAHGTFGITYLAKFRQKVTGQMGAGTVSSQVCIKEFFMHDFCSRAENTSELQGTSQTIVDKYRRAFLREANNLAKMNHEGIVNIFEVIEANQTVYIVMEYIEGNSLDGYIASRGRLPEAEALDIFRQICLAVHYMHSQRMLHLDIKPKNAMRDDEGHMYLIDFGLSKQYSSDGEPESSTNIGLGTPGYAPSEQANQTDGDKTFRATIDVYALGATLFKMLTGERPPLSTEVTESVFNDDNIIEKMLKEAEVSATTIQHVAKAMFPGCKKRYQTVAELMQAFGWSVPDYESQPASSSGEVQAIEDEATEVIMEEDKPVPAPKPATEPSHENRRQNKSKSLGILIGIAAVVLAVGLFFLFGGGKSSQEPLIATVQEEAIVNDTPPVANSSVSNADASTVVEETEVLPVTTGTLNGHEWVDLGLPSGTRWATMNLGANSPSDRGSYFAWGETKPKSDYTLENYKFIQNGNSDKYTKYVVESKYGTVDNKKSLDLADDAAHVNWGKGWQMPTPTQQRELMLKCKFHWTKVNGQDVCKVVGPNGNSIVVPLAGEWYSGKVGDTDAGFYWSKAMIGNFGSEGSSCACYFWFWRGGSIRSHEGRSVGLSIRAVCTPE